MIIPSSYSLLIQFIIQKVALPHHHNDETIRLRMNQFLRPFDVVRILLVCFPFKNVQAFHHVFTGTGALEVQLIAAKLALKSGDTCSIICPPNPDRIKKCIALMYGQEAGKKYSDYDESRNSEISIYGLPEFACDGDSIGAALDKADGIIIACEDQGVDDNYVDALLSSAKNIKHLALLSRHGGKLKAMETSILKKCEEPDEPIPFSILRAGNLVGGGPGGELAKQRGEEWGLSKYFYDTKYDLVDATITMSMDKFTLGAKVTPGDPFKGPNFFSKVMAGNSFEPRNGDTGRIAAAQALITAVRRDGSGVDVSISTKKGEEPPSLEEWNTLLECK